MAIRYAHTNIVSKDLKKLANFYAKVFGCKLERETKMSGEWLEKGTGVKGADIKGITLILPGYEANPLTLEIFQYNEVLDKTDSPAANRQGYGHLAFNVDDESAVLEKILAEGGSKVGEISVKEFKGGTLTFVYAADPEGNMLELMNWKKK